MGKGEMKIKLREYRAELLHIYKRVSAAQLAMPSIACAARCTACCTRQVVTLSMVEKLNLIRRLNKIGSSEVRQRIWGNMQLASAMQKQYGVGNFVIDESGGFDQLIQSLSVGEYIPTCPLLVDGLCAVYADRPFICRAFISNDPGKCGKRGYDAEHGGVSMMEDGMMYDQWIVSQRVELAQLNDRFVRSVPALLRDSLASAGIGGTESRGLIDIVTTVYLDVRLDERGDFRLFVEKEAVEIG